MLVLLINLCYSFCCIVNEHIMVQCQILPYGSSIGIIGGGQLARMLSLAAANLGYKTTIFDPDVNCPAAEVSHKVISAQFDNQNEMSKFCNSVSFITFEFENINTSVIPDNAITRPHKSALTISQNRKFEKEFINSCGIKTAEYQYFPNITSFVNSPKNIISYPSILKTCTLGYDGHGQYMIKNSSDITNEIPNHDSGFILEKFVDFKKEISIIVARDIYKNVAFFPIAQNIHKNGILHISTIDSDITENIKDATQIIAKTLVEKLDLNGILAIEMFVTEGDVILVNEIAARPHNSGHWSMNACNISQFTQLIRILAGFPVIDVTNHSACTMINLLGNDIKNIDQYYNNHNACLHIYNKSIIKPNRKMGHVNILSQK